MRHLVYAGLLVLALALAGCSDNSSPVSPSSTSLNLTGTWSGEILVEVTRARMTWTLTQTNNAVSGPVLVSLMTGTVLLNGTLAGTLTGSTLDYTITVQPGGIPTQPACSGQLGGTATATVDGPSTLTGTFSLLTSVCVPPVSTLSFVLTRQ